MVHSRTTGLGAEGADEWGLFWFIFQPQQVAPGPYSSTPDPPVRLRALTNSLEGLLAAVRDRPRDMFTASGGTEEK